LPHPVVKAPKSADCQNNNILYNIHGSCPFVKIKFKDFQGTYEQYIKRTELNQTGTFVNIYKQVQFTFNNLTPSSINQKLELSEKMKAIHHSDTGYTDSENHLFGHGILENQIQVLLRTFKHRFKNFQGPCVLSRIF